MNFWKFLFKDWNFRNKMKNKRGGLGFFPLSHHEPHKTINVDKFGRTWKGTTMTMKLVLPIVTLPPLLPLVVNQRNFWTFLSYQHIINKFIFFLNVQLYVMIIDLCTIGLCYLSNFISNYIHLISSFFFSSSSTQDNQCNHSHLQKLINVIANLLVCLCKYNPFGQTHHYLME